jgi:hypothetical protein
MGVQSDQTFYSCKPWLERYNLKCISLLNRLRTFLFSGFKYSGRRSEGLCSCTKIASYLLTGQLFLRFRIHSPSRASLRLSRHHRLVSLFISTGLVCDRLFESHQLCKLDCTAVVHFDSTRSPRKKLAMSMITDFWQLLVAVLNTAECRRQHKTLIYFY